MLRHTLIAFFALVSLLVPASADAGPAFDFADAQARAQDLAQKVWADAPAAPEFLVKLNYGEWSGIRYRKDKAVWADENLPFTLEFFHQGLYYDRPVKMHLVDEAGVSDISFDPSLFNYGSEKLANQVAETSGLDFAGFRIHYPLNNADYKDEVAIFLGASYFRALAKGNHYGIYSRGLALDTASPQGEEFPYFREFWVVKPLPEDRSITIFALMDSPRMAGAYRFVITPGAPTEMDVKCALFTRKDAKNYQKLGLAPLTSMFFYGEETNGRPGDYRPEVHNSDGLLFVDGEGHWFWSPVVNPKRLAVNTFPLTNPRGFGLMQRDCAFPSYQDLGARYDLRPSLWVEPQGEWGPGTINLIEIPTEDEMHDNIVVFWSPDKPRSGNADQPAEELRYPDMQMYSWKLFWQQPGAIQHEKGKIVSTRVSRSADTVTFHIDFAGEALSSLPADTGLSSIVETPEPIPMLEKKLTHNPMTGGWRLVFKVRLPKEEGVLQSLMSARKGPVTLRFRALLKKGENLPDPLTETWVYDWQMQP
jgi:glucans biosynthesis protein